MNTQLRAWSEGVLEACVLFAVAAVPVFVNFYSFRVFEPDKNAIFIALGTLMALGGLVALVEGGLGRLQGVWRRPLVASALLLLVASTIATLFSPLPRLSFFGSQERAQGLLSLIGVLVLFGVVAALARSPQARSRILAVLVTASIPVAVYAVIQALGIQVIAGEVESTARVFSTLSNPIFLGAYLMFLVPITLSRALAAARAGRPAVFSGLVIVTLLQVAALLLTVSRGPLLGLGAGLFVFLLAGAIATGRRTVALGSVLFALVVALFLVVFNLPASPLAAMRDLPIVGRFGRITDVSSGSEAARYHIWGAVDRLLAAEPGRLAIGHGPETLMYVLLPYGETNLAGRGQADRLVDRAHNVFLDALTMTGIAGALALLLVYGAWLFTATATLGLAQGGSKRLLALCLALGTLLGALSWFVLPVYAGAITLLGLVLGLVVYLCVALFRHEPGDGPDLVDLGLLACGVAAVVEAAFGIQTVVTQVIFWTLAGVVVARSLGDQVEALQATSAQRRPTAAPEAAEPGTISFTWSTGGAALGLVFGTLMGLFVYSFFVFGTAPLPATTGAVLLLAVAAWLAGLLAAADTQEGVAACAITSIVTVGLYLLVRQVTLVATQDATQLFAVTLLWILALALLAGVWLKRPTGARTPFWRGPVGMVYPIVAVLAVAFIYLASVRPVQADIAYQSGVVNFAYAMQNDDADRLAIGDELLERAVSLNPNEDGYRLKWGEFYTEIGAVTADQQAYAVAFAKAQQLVEKAEKLNPLMPYHKFNRGHLQLVFAQKLQPGEQQSQAAGNAAVAIQEAFNVVPYDPQVTNELALAKLLSGDSDGAVVLLQHSLKLEPGKMATYQLLAQAYQAAGKADEAEKVLQDALQAGADGAPLLTELGDLARERNDLNAAINWYQQAAQAEPESWGVHYNLGLLYRDAGEFQEALAELSNAMRVVPPEDRQRVQDALDHLAEGVQPGLAPPTTP